MNPLSIQLPTLVWHRHNQIWGRHIGPDPADPASTCFVQWGAGDDPVRAAVDDLLTAEHPSAGQIDRPAPDAIEVRAGSAGSDEPTQILWYVPGRRPENLRPEAFSITRKLVAAGLFDWAEAFINGDQIARTDGSSR